MATTVYVILGTVIGGVILAGLSAAYFSNLLPWVLVGIVLVLLIAAVLYFRGKSRPAARQVTPPTVTLKRTPDTVQQLDKVLTRKPPTRRPPIVMPKKGMKHVVTVSLDTEVNPFDFHTEFLESGDIIEVEAVSEAGATFHFLVCDDYQLALNKNRTVNFEFYEGKMWTTQFKKRFEIPETGNWHFVAYTPEGEEFATVGLTVSKRE